MDGILYLIPVTLGDTPIDKVLPSYNNSIISEIKHFIVEDIRSARRFLKKSSPDIVIDDLTFYTLNDHTHLEDMDSYLQAIKSGCDIGIISEAGCPAIADPGANIVEIAQKRGIKVVPLVGPSSILMSLMASGFNGQKFTFNGYIPIEAEERSRSLKALELRAYNENNTQIFIETPYRNNKILDDILRTCRPQTQLCIAANISCEGEFIRSMSVKEWSTKKPDINKIPTIFLIYK
ncbi:MAG: SAM-dependent methyltransferase [Bacteroidales bacterium]